MANDNTVTCSFTMNRDLYNQYKSILVRSGKNVKDDLVRHMQEVIDLENPNAETIATIEEVKKMKENPSIGKSYTDVGEMMEDLLK